MSNLAYWFLNYGWQVSGSDIIPSQITRELQKNRVKIKIGHKRTNLPKDCNLVVYSQAIKKNNPELNEAKRLKIPAVSYPEMLGQITKNYKTIAVAGAHGKSTTSSLLGLVLENAGLDPTVIVGTKLQEFGGKGFRAGKGKYLVIEADEYGGAFLHYSPFIAVITNIDREHLDFYRNLRNIKNAFLAFIKNIIPGGGVVLNQDNKYLRSFKPRVKTVWYSLRQPEAKKIRKAIFISGEHNVSNALAVYKTARLLGIPEKKILEVFKKYRGSWRRMEYKGKFKIQNSKFKVDVYDDYAHHPTEIKATIQAFREKYPKNKILCVFQPHQAKRLNALFKDFQTAFDEADITIVLPVYRVAGRETKNNKQNIKSKTSEDLVRAIRKKQPRKLIFYLADHKKLKKTIENFIQSPTVIVMMGAGNIVNYTNELIAKSEKNA